MENRPNYYSVTPASVRYDFEITANARLLYGEISALASKEGYCWASNKYFAELYQVSERTITEWLASLHKQGHIELIESKGGRRILLGGWKKTSRGVEENFYPKNEKILNDGLMKPNSEVNDRPSITSSITSNNAFQENLKSEKKKVETARPQTFEEFMEEKGYVFGELKDNDGGIIDMWLNGNRGVSAGLLKSLQADHKRLYPELYVGKTAPPLKESVIDEIVVIWNSYHTLPANLGAFNNKTAKTLLPKVDHQSFDLKREIKKKLKFYPHVSDWERAIKAYASEILNRDPSQSYALHRLSLYEFVLQKNGLIKFFNK